MSGNLELLVPVLLPIILGGIVVSSKKLNKTVSLRVITAVVLLFSSAMVLYNNFFGEKMLHLWNLTDTLPIMFRVDATGRLFSTLVCVMWILVAFFSFDYIKHEEREHQVLIALDYAGNLMTMYLCYELMTIITVPLVIHSRTKEAIAAGFKYLIYSLFGAFMGLLGIFFINYYGKTLEFVPGGVFSASALQSNQGILLVVVFIAILGFSTKAGMFPLHGWLPTAHPVAPAPASAILSGIITKSGVLALIRLIYYIFGADFIRGTWVQYTWIILALITILMGSMMAYKEKVFKKRLAYSTVSQVSYILLGLALLTPTAFSGAIMHVVFHSTIKITLFLSAGAIIYKTGLTNVDDYRGIGQKMPITLAFYSVSSLALVGIPPLSGFISKWYLASGSMESGVEVLSWLAPVVLLISAILTAGYLLPIILDGYFPGKEFSKKKRDECSPFMLVPMGILSIATVFFGVVPNGLFDFIQTIVNTVF
ncbi:MAG: proton-conducting transporter membrane subunit [Oscillospiraceae bacterium]